MTMSRHASKLSAVHRGTAFEQRSLQLLQTHFSMSLRRVGGKSDGGIDLIGWWWLPFATDSDPIHRPGALPDSNGLLRRRIRVLAQCKAEKKKFTPKYVREMEGVWHLQARSSPSLAAHPSSPTPSLPSSLTYEPIVPDAYPIVALLLSESPFSQSTALHAYRSTVPFLLIHLPCPSSSSNSSATIMSASDIELGTVCPNPMLTELVKPLAFCWERNPSASPSMETDVHAGVDQVFGGRAVSWVVGHLNSRTRMRLETLPSVPVFQGWITYPLWTYFW
ncbi:hypothetical protein JVT61DRAFT_10418 [Boletus reticuloceps]|uniref:Uncharacterized protein n=1 Tax=Boletus reticuloceps TaxID=495285 RepID=A0A8I2YZF9_9AGAM|nr:hypothetical protein JVT61DRAFT_10418 [Boletus reticuloceps]